MGAADPLRSHRVSLMKCVLRLVAILPLALAAAVPTLAQASPPVIVSSVGYINGKAQTAHTSTAFNSTGASTLVAFVSTNTPWNGLPVSISGLSDSLGNTWNLLTGPTVFSGSVFTLQSAVYYVNGPVSGATQTVTVQLTNPAPLVFHVFAVSGSDVTGPPISSAITEPGAGGTSANVTTAPVTVPTNSLLLSWVKNETSATATALNGFTLDTQSTSYLWAESETPISAGSYTGDFQYDSAIGWQTAIVGVKPHSPLPPTPVITSTPSNPTNETSASFSFTDTETGVSFFCQLDGSAFSACSSPTTYSGLSLGNHTFSVKAQDAAGNQSAAATFSWTIGVMPTVSSVSPNNGPAAGGTAVTITGTNFAAGATVTFGGTAATNVVVVSGTQITATTPAHAAGTVTVTVTVNSQSGNLSNGFTYNPAVAIAFAQVAAATPQSPTATVSVTYPAAQTAGDLNVVVVGWNDTTSTVQSVKDSGGNNYSLAIGPTTGTALRQSIYYLSNIAGGNNTVTVTFNQPAVYPDVRILEYRGVTAVDVTAGASGSGTAANSGSATTTSASELIFGANTVATSTGAAGSGFTQRIITSPNGDIAEDKVVTTAGSNSATATLTSSGPWVRQMVTFSAGPVPRVSSVAPNNGPTAGGTAVTITGTNFAAGATVTFGGTAATNVVVVSGTQITATTPAHAAGTVTVTVTVNSQSGNLSNGFTYNPAVAIAFAQVAAATPQSPTATVSVTYPAAQTAGDLNVVVVGWNDTTSTVQSVKDSGGNNYSLAIGPTTGTALRQSIFYLSIFLMIRRPPRSTLFPRSAD